MFRVVTFTAVIAVHAISSTVPSANTAGNSVLALLHYTREGFFFLAAFVLVYGYYDRPLRGGDVWPFWRKRFLLVGVPYVVWTALYTVPTMVHRGESVGDMSSGLLQHLLRGDGKYHLYFLLVSLQLYLLTPALLWAVRRCTGHHLLLLAGSFAAQAVTSWYIQFGHTSSGLPQLFRHNSFMLIVSYQFWIVLGAVTAVHRAAALAFVRTHRPALAGVVVGGAALTVGWVHWAGATWIGSSGSASVFQPVLILWFSLAILGVALVGSFWADWHQRLPRPAGWVRAGSDASFGVYLVHPAILGWVIAVLPALPSGYLAALAVVLTWSFSAVFVFAARRTPLSLPLCGRHWERPRAVVSERPVNQGVPTRIAA
jgi:peptidoglycan/LPS O-acetylase OafA/YrhL